VYHFIGIGGVGMSALARVMRQRGRAVSGSDCRESYVTTALLDEGIEVAIGHRAEHVCAGQVVVYSTDIKPDNVEWKAAVENKKLHRSELLEELLCEKEAILVAGAHGKTTTTSLLAYVCELAGLSPSFVIGGFSPSLHGINGKWGDGDYFIAEADESDGSFLRASPLGAIITNVDFDHLNYWKTKEALLEAYQKFIRGVLRKDLLFYLHEDPYMSVWNLGGISYGFDNKADLVGKNLRFHDGKQLFTIEFQGKSYSDIELNLLGRHNVLNALACFGMALSIGVPIEAIRAAFSSFKGTQRRLELKGYLNGSPIYDDYAHHPKEIAATLQALKEAFKEQKKIAIFQPHRYSRLQDLMDEFAKKEVWQDCDRLIVTDIFSAGEEKIPGVTIEAFLDKLEFKSTYVPREEVVHFIKSQLISGDVVIALGAGDITGVSRELVE
jgi:UDP-N-acetylmuramate--alanine ligase